MNQVNILHIIHWPKSGIVNLVYNQVVANRNPSIKYKVGFFVEDYETRSKFESAGVEVVNYNYHPLLFFIAIINIILDIRKSTPQIVHTHSFLPGLFARVICLYAKSFRLVSTIHNSYPYFKGNNVKDRLKIFLEINSINRVNSKIICVSRYVKEYLLKHTGLNSELVDIVYLGIAIDRDDSGIISNKPESSNRVIIVGRLDKQKRHDRLLSIWKKVVEAIPEAKLDIVGHGSEKDNLVRTVNELKLKQNVSFLGFRDDIPELLRGSDFSVLTSSYEGLPVAIAESFLQKRPVIAFEIDSLREIIDDNCGILVKPFDIDEFAEKVVYLLSNPHIAKALGENGYNKVLTHFDINRMVDEIENIYIKVLAENKTA